MNSGKTIVALLLGLALPILLSAQELMTLEVEGLELTFVRVPAGETDIGSNDQNRVAQEDEKPVFTAVISQDFFLGQTEVTQALWEKVMGYNPSVFRDPQRPVEMVSWHDCMAFVRKLNAAWTGEGHFALPTEAQWEYAARLAEPDYRNEDGTIRVADLRRYAWFNSRSEGKSHPVATKEADRMGFHDLLGNVWEWCADWKSPYDAQAKTDPLQQAPAERRVYRGGSWFNEPEALRPENRHGHGPDQPFTNAGLRLVYSKK